MRAVVAVLLFVTAAHAGLWGLFQEKRPAPDFNMRGLGPVEPLISPPLVHWVLLTRACDDRSRCGMTLAQDGSFRPHQIVAI